MNHQSQPPIWVLLPTCRLAGQPCLLSLVYPKVGVRLLLFLSIAALPAGVCTSAFLAVLPILQETSHGHTPPHRQRFDHLPRELHSWILTSCRPLPICASGISCHRECRTCTSSPAWLSDIVSVVKVAPFPERSFPFASSAIVC